MARKTPVLQNDDIPDYENLYQMKPVTNTLLKAVKEVAADIHYFYGVSTEELVTYFARKLDIIGEKGIATIMKDFTQSNTKNNDFKQWARNNRCDEYANHVYAPFLQSLWKYFDSTMATRMQRHLTPPQLNAFKHWAPIRVILKCLGRAVKPEVKKNDKGASKNQNQQNEIVLFRNRCFAGRKQTAWKTALLLFVEEDMRDSREIVKSLENYRDYLVVRERQLDRILGGANGRNNRQIQDEGKEENEEEQPDSKIPDADADDANDGQLEEILADFDNMASCDDLHISYGNHGNYGNYTGGESHSTSDCERASEETDRDECFELALSAQPETLLSPNFTPQQMMTFDNRVTRNVCDNQNVACMDHLYDFGTRNSNMNSMIPDSADNYRFQVLSRIPSSRQSQPSVGLSESYFSQSRDPYGPVRNPPLHQTPFAGPLDLPQNHMSQFLSGCTYMQQEMQTPPMPQMSRYSARANQMGPLEHFQMTRQRGSGGNCSYLP